MKEVTLGDVCAVTTGQSAPQADDAFTEVGTPFIRAGSLGGLLAGKLESEFEKITEEKAKQYRLNLFKKDTVVFAKSGMSAKIGRVYRLKQDCYLVSHLAAITPSKKVDPGYLHRWFEKNPPSRLITNDAYPSIKTSEIKKVIIPIPSLEDQKRIAAILDKADAIRRKRQQAIDLTDQLLRSVFLDMFGDPVANLKGWNMLPIGEIADVKTGGTPSRKKPEYYGGDIPWVKTTEVDGDVILDTEEKITDKGLSCSNCALFPPRSIVIAMYGQGKTRGRSAMLGISAATNQACAVILPNDGFNQYFLREYIRLSYDKIRELGRGGNQPNLNLSLVKGFKVFVPPLDLQQQFVDIVEKINKSYQHKVNAQKLNNELFNSLTHNAFQGKLIKLTEAA